MSDSLCRAHGVLISERLNVLLGSRDAINRLGSRDVNNRLGSRDANNRLDSPVAMNLLSIIILKIYLKAGTVHEDSWCNFIIGDKIALLMLDSLCTVHGVLISERLNVLLMSDNL